MLGAEQEAQQRQEALLLDKISVSVSMGVDGSRLSKDRQDGIYKKYVKPNLVDYTILEIVTLTVAHHLRVGKNVEPRLALGRALSFEESVSKAITVDDVDDHEIVYASVFSIIPEDELKLRIDILQNVHTWTEAKISRLRAERQEAQAAIQLLEVSTSGRVELHTTQDDTASLNGNSPKTERVIQENNHETEVVRLAPGELVSISDYLKRDMKGATLDGDLFINGDDSGAVAIVTSTDIEGWFKAELFTLVNPRGRVYSTDVNLSRNYITAGNYRSACNFLDAVITAIIDENPESPPIISSRKFDHLLEICTDMCVNGMLFEAAIQLFGSGSPANSPQINYMNEHNQLVYLSRLSYCAEKFVGILIKIPDINPERLFAQKYVPPPDNKRVDPNSEEGQKIAANAARIKERDAKVEFAIEKVRINFLMGSLIGVDPETQRLVFSDSKQQKWFDRLSASDKIGYTKRLKEFGLLE